MPCRWTTMRRSTRAAAPSCRRLRCGSVRPRLCSIWPLPRRQLPNQAPGWTSPRVPNSLPRWVAACIGMTHEAPALPGNEVKHAAASYGREEELDCPECDRSGMLQSARGRTSVIAMPALRANPDSGMAGRLTRHLSHCLCCRQPSQSPEHLYASYTMPASGCFRGKGVTQVCWMPLLT